jgi:hypothetical protein
VWSVGTILCILAVVEACWWSDLQSLSRANQAWHESLRDMAKSRKLYQADLDRGRDAIAWLLNDLAARYPHHQQTQQQRDLFNMKMAEHSKVDWRNYDA